MSKQYHIARLFLKMLGISFHNKKYAVLRVLCHVKLNWCICWVWGQRTGWRKWIGKKNPLWNRYCLLRLANLLCPEQLPRFFQLCSDNVWGVRKACAECFMAVSCATSQEVRRTKLSTLFINLISDPSRWVRIAFYFLNNCYGLRFFTVVFCM